MNRTSGGIALALIIILIIILIVIALSQSSREGFFIFPPATDINLPTTPPQTQNPSPEQPTGPTSPPSTPSPTLTP